MLIGMAVSLYTSRVILEVIGVTDFGVYNVVGGVVSMLSFLNSAMSGATSRFLTYNLGNNDIKALKETFNSSLFVHLIIALIIVVLCETIGLWLLEYKLEIPAESQNAAFWVFQCSVFSVIVSITQIPYTASIIAHEEMKAFAYIDLLNTFFKLGIVYLLMVIPGDKLKIYGFLTVSLSTVIAYAYRVYCIRHFQECHIQLICMRKNMVWKMLNFSGWDLVGNLSVIGRTQGIAILANMFFGAVANASIGIANQIQGAVNAFANNITMAIKPQIIKSYAKNDFEREKQLIYLGSKVAFMLILFLGLPLVLEMPYILKLWLNVVPEYSVAISRWTLAFIMFSNISVITVTGVHATGDVRLCSIVNGILYLSVIPITYIAYKMNGSIYFPFCLNAVFIIIGSIMNFYYASRYIKTFSTYDFIKRVIFRCLLLASFCFFLVILVSKSVVMPPFQHLCIVVFSSFITVPLMSLWLLLSRGERAKILEIVKNIVPISLKKQY